MKLNFPNASIAFFLILALQGCHLGPKYELPPSEIPEDWKNESAEGKPDVEFWWELFQDEHLSQLEKQLLSQNFKLSAALDQVAVARAAAGVAKASLYPQASLRPGYNDTGQLNELYGVPQGLFPGLKTIVRVHEMTYELPLNMSYEVDLWQKNRGTFNALEMNAQARQEAYRTTLLMLTSDLASNYYNAKTLDTQIVLLEKSVRIYSEILKFRQLRYLVGLDSYLDLLFALQQYENSEARYEDSLAQRGQFENAIAVLVGETASCFKLESAPVMKEPPVIPAGLPSTLLTRRPDIAEAERMMAAEQALIGVAYASFYPALNLTGALGFLSPDLNQFLSWAGHLWQWGAKIVQMVFDGGRDSSFLEGAKALFKEAVNSYQNTVLVAFQEVEDALRNLEYEKKQADDLWRSFDAAGARTKLYDQRFDSGMVNQIDVLTIELAEIEAELSWVNVLGLRYQATIQLIKAIGGSWDCEQNYTQSDSKIGR